VFSRPRSQRWLENLSHVQQLGQQFTIPDENGCEGLNEGCRGKVSDDSTLTLPRFKQAGEFKNADGVSYGSAADFEPIREFPFGGQLVAGPQAPFGDEPANPVGNLLVNLGAPNRREFADDQ